MRRPLSPHLQVYRVQISSGLSALHRITSILLAFSCAKVMFALVLAFFFPDFWSQYVGPLLTPIILKLGLLGFFAIWWFHTLTSLRHLYWDCGGSLEKDDMVRSGKYVLFLWCGGMLLFSLTLIQQG